ncbi:MULTISPECIES: SGNH/GDSL hydrolase family protein [unclassified Streptomyces]|uniref:SGNH/GDSL hydrolase family protein n=1 Tax=unclassified Streptomyces TaxID=2593676 RepID=UPI001F01B727|nr:MULTISPECIES: SGNH/GDSL hydrolase family protein [unclassified Streptomyces]
MRTRVPVVAAMRRRLLPAVVALVLGSLVAVAGCGAGGTTPDARRSAGQISRAAAPSGGPHQAPKPVRPWNDSPASVAALGDSITRGFDACDPLADCPAVSWATGSRTAIDSLSSRLTAAAPSTRSWNLARSGARVADLTAQAHAAAAHRPAMVTVLIGANDACTSTAGTMTSVADFRADFDSALTYLHRTLPDTQILVASIPDLERLWSVGRTNVFGEAVWKLGLCPSMLRDANVQTAAAQQRRTAVRDRVIAYNTAMGQVCSRFARCRYDGGAVFDYRFSTKELSQWDWFHPNEEGQAVLARILAGVAGLAEHG